MKEVFINYP